MDRIDCPPQRGLRVRTLSPHHRQLYHVPTSSRPTLREALTNDRFLLLLRHQSPCSMRARSTHLQRKPWSHRNPWGESRGVNQAHNNSLPPNPLSNHGCLPNVRPQHHQQKLKQRPLHPRRSRTARPPRAKAHRPNAPGPQNQP